MRTLYFPLVVSFSIFHFPRPISAVADRMSIVICLLVVVSSFCVVALLVDDLLPVGLVVVDATVVP